MNAAQIAHDIWETLRQYVPEERRVTLAQRIVRWLEDDPEVTIVRADDWEGLYIGDRLIDAGHSLRIDDVLRHLQIDCQVLHANEQWLEECGSLPPNLEEVQTR